jgi:hypothetical protein
MAGKSSRSARAGLIGAQSNPELWVIVHPIHVGLASCADITMSASP